MEMTMHRYNREYLDSKQPAIKTKPETI